MQKIFIVVLGGGAKYCEEGFKDTESEGKAFIQDLKFPLGAETISGHFFSQVVVDCIVMLKLIFLCFVQIL